MQIQTTVPIRIDDQLVGLAFSDSGVPNAHTSHEEALLLQFADYTATSIRSAQGYADQERHLARYRVLLSVLPTITASLDSKTVNQAILNAVTAVFTLPCVVLWDVDDVTHTLTVKASSPPRLAQALSPSAFSQDGADWVAATRQPLYLADVFTATVFQPSSWWRLSGFSSLYALPVLFNDTLYAVLALYDRQPLPYNEETQESLEQIVRQAAYALHNTSLHTAALAPQQQRHV